MIDKNNDFCIWNMFYKLVMKILNNIVWGNLEKKYIGLVENDKYEMIIKVWRMLEVSFMLCIIIDGFKFFGFV